MDRSVASKLGVTRALVSAGVQPGELGKFIADETGKWAKVIRAANITAQ
jgi:hypothetical protein